MRARFWRNEYRAAGWARHRFASLHLPSRGKVVLWTSSWLADALFIWRMTHLLSERPVELWIADLGTRAGLGGLGAMLPDEACEVARSARPAPPRTLRRDRRAWSAWVEGDLREVSRHLDRAGLQPILDALPRIGARSLRISARDESMLRPFSTWRRPLEALGSALAELMVFGDLAIAVRLLRWAAAGVLEQRPPGGRSQWSNVEYRLTTAGRRLLVQLQPSVAPPMMMGGHTVYGPRSWGVTRSGGLRRVAGLREAASPPALPAHPRGRRRS